MAQGVGYVPRERKVEGIVAGMNVYENMTLSQLGRYASGGVLRVAQEKALARDWIGRLSIKAHSELADCSNLSGGNQQKVVLAKWRSGGSDIMLLDHPTRGLDIGAKEDVYDMIRDMCDDGVCVEEDWCFGHMHTERTPDGTLVQRTVDHDADGIAARRIQAHSLNSFVDCERPPCMHTTHTRVE